jgi:hypothetical protein
MKHSTLCELDNEPDLRHPDLACVMVTVLYNKISPKYIFYLARESFR